MSLQTTEVNPNDIQKAIQSCNFAEKNVCFVGNLSEKVLETTLKKIGCCAHGVMLQKSQKGLIDLIAEKSLDTESIQRILIQEAKDAVSEQKSKAIVLALFGYEKYYDAINEAVPVEVLKPSSILPSILDPEKRSLGLIGTSFDLDQNFWDHFAREHNVRIVLPNESDIAELSTTLRHAIRLKGQSINDLERCCFEQVKRMLKGPNPPSQILLCNLELNNTLKRLACENHDIEFLDMYKVLRKLVVHFDPS